jgi:hypothetical protein
MDREAEVARVVEAMRGRGRLVLYGERRMGKSSVIARAAERVRGDGGVVLTADAWTLAGLDELNRALMAAVPGNWRGIVQETPHLAYVWDALPVTKRQVLRAVADGEQKLTSKEVLDRYRGGMVRSWRVLRRPFASGSFRSPSTAGLRRRAGAPRRSG